MNGHAAPPKRPLGPLPPPLAAACGAAPPGGGPILGTAAKLVAALHDSHRISAAAVFDQFPYTHHLECGLLLAKR